MTYSPPSSLGPFINTFQEFPIDNTQEMKRVLTKMYTDLSQAINFRESGAFELSELLTGQQFYTVNNNQTKRFVYRKCFETGAIASGATASIAHGISPLTTFTNIYGTVQTDSPDWRPVPFSSTVNVTNQISIRVTTTNIVIGNGATAPNIVSGIVILEYLKN